MARDALVVGINTYQYSGLPKLNSPALDAEAIALSLENIWNISGYPSVQSEYTGTFSFLSSGS